MERKFLVPLSVAIAALTQTSEAAITKSSVVATKLPEGIRAPQSDETTPQGVAEATVRYPLDGNLFEFVLHRSENGNVMAYHRSHYSHQSHSSHSSHSSHRSHYSSRW